MVAECFLPNPEGKTEINHIDGNKENNDISNLEWTSRKENAEHAVKNKLYRYTKRFRVYKDGEIVYDDISYKQVASIVGMKDPTGVYHINSKNGYKWESI